MGKCEICGKEFVSKHRATLCSRECREEAHRIAMRKYQAKKRKEKAQEKAVEKICVICGAIITDTRKRKYCSGACADIGYQENCGKANEKLKEQRRTLKEKSEGKCKKTTLDDTLNAMNKYNALHNTRLDYGQYSRMIGL